MFKINSDIDNFLLKVYEDKFVDDSIVRMEIIIDDKNKESHKKEFEQIMEQIKSIAEDSNKSLNIYKILLKLLRTEEIFLSRDNVNLSPVDIFPQFSIVQVMSDGRTEYKGSKHISWEMFCQFSNSLSHIVKSK